MNHYAYGKIQTVDSFFIKFTVGKTKNSKNNDENNVPNFRVVFQQIDDLLELCQQDKFKLKYPYFLRSVKMIETKKIVIYLNSPNS